MKRGEATNHGTAIAGVVLSTVATVVGAVIAVVFLVLIINYQECIEHAPSRYEYGKC